MGKDAKKTRKDRNKKVAVKDLTPKRAEVVGGADEQPYTAQPNVSKPGRALR